MFPAASSDTDVASMEDVKTFTEENIAQKDDPIIQSSPDVSDSQNALQRIFSYQGSQVRTAVDEDKAVWFAAKDVAEALDKVWNGKILDTVSTNHKGMRKFLTPGGTQELSVIDASAVYKLAFRSNKAEAAKFTDWELTRYYLLFKSMVYT